MAVLYIYIDVAFIFAKLFWTRCFITTEIYAIALSFLFELGLTEF